MFRIQILMSSPLMILIKPETQIWHPNLDVTHFSRRVKYIWALQKCLESGSECLLQVPCKFAFKIWILVMSETETQIWVYTPSCTKCSVSGSECLIQVPCISAFQILTLIMSGLIIRLESGSECLSVRFPLDFSSRSGYLLCLELKHRSGSTHQFVQNVQNLDLNVYYRSPAFLPSRYWPLSCLCPKLLNEFYRF